MTKRKVLMASIAAGSVLLAAASHGADWPQWGRTADRNMVSPETGLPDFRAAASDEATVFNAEGSP